MSIHELPELAALERVMDLGRSHLSSQVVCKVDMPDGSAYPVYAIT